MTKISSGRTWFHKRVFPVVWFGIIGVVLVVAFVADAFRKAPVALIAPVVMAIFGFFLMKKLVWDLVDEVYDGGDYLVVKNGGMEERIPLSNIMNVNASTLVNPPRVTLRLVNRGRFGNEIAFSPVMPFTLNPFARNQVADDLMVRVDKARSRRAA